MHRLIKSSFVFTLLICYSFSTKVLFDCYLNKGQKNEIKLGFSHHNYVFANSNSRKRDIKVDKIIGIHESVKSSESVEHISISEVFFYGEGMNILHFLEGGETQVCSLGNYVSRKFRAFVMSVKLLDPTEKYKKPANVPIEDLMNKSLYYKGKLPEFSFDINKTTYTAQCEILPATESVVNVTNTIPNNTVVVQNNGSQVVSGVHKSSINLVI